MKLEIESGSLEDVNLIKTGDTFIHEFRTIIDNIRHIFATRPLIVIRHVLREANNCVDTYAKMGARSTTQLSL